MKRSEIKLVQNSFDALPLPFQFVPLFYSTLFQRAPDIRHMFASDIGPQADKLFKALKLALGRLEQPEMFHQKLLDMGAHHGRLGVQPEHYALVQEVLLTCLEEELGKLWTAAHANAWRKMLDSVCDTMIEGARSR